MCSILTSWTINHNIRQPRFWRTVMVFQCMCTNRGICCQNIYKKGVVRSSVQVFHETWCVPKEKCEADRQRLDLDPTNCQVWGEICARAQDNTLAIPEGTPAIQEDTFAILRGSGQFSCNTVKLKPILLRYYTKHCGAQDRRTSDKVWRLSRKSPTSSTDTLRRNRCFWSMLGYRPAHRSINLAV